MMFRNPLAAALIVAGSATWGATGCSRRSSPPAASPASADSPGDAGASVPGLPPSPETDMNKKPSLPPALTVVAQALQPKAEALAYLARAQAAGTEMKLPVELDVAALGIGGGHLGFAGDRIAVKLDDAALGVSLSDRAAQWCGEEATRCAMWLWARWRDGTLVVLRADAKINDEDRAGATHIHVAK
jgi:hypothetical protein